MPVSDVFTFPFGSYLKVRLEYVLICDDELVAKLLHIIESHVQDERKRIYREYLNDPKNDIDPGDVVDVTRDLWVPISYRLFKYELFDETMADNTLRRAIRRLRLLGFITVDGEDRGKYQPPSYHLETSVIQAHLDLLGAIKKREYQKMMVSFFDTIKNVSYQILNPSDYQNLIPSLALRVSKNDSNSNYLDSVITSSSNSSDDSASSENTRANFDHALVPARRVSAVRAPAQKEKDGPPTSARASCLPGFDAGSPPAAPRTRQSVRDEKKEKTPKEPRRTRQPRVVEVPFSREEITTYFDAFDEIMRVVLNKPDAPGYNRPQTDYDRINTLLQMNVLKPGSVTPERVKRVYLRMWNTESEPGSGKYWWRDHMSISAVCKNYNTFAIMLMREASERDAKKKANQSNRSGMSSL